MLSDLDPPAGIPDDRSRHHDALWTSAGVEGGLGTVRLIQGRRRFESFDLINAPGTLDMGEPGTLPAVGNELRAS